MICQGVMVGEYFADLLVEGVLLVEVKTVEALDGAHRMQCTNYLKATVCGSACCSISGGRAWR
jgi:GxxExxY protein